MALHRPAWTVASVLITGLWGTTAAAQPADTPPRWTLQVDPLTTALGFVHLQAERALGEFWSVYAGPSLRLYDGVSSLDDPSGFRGYGGEAGVRWFYFGGAPAGWWHQVRGVVAYLDAQEGDANGVGGYVSTLAGYTWIYEETLVLSGGLGVQYIDYTLEGKGQQGVFPAAHSTIGVAF